MLTTVKQIVELGNLPDEGNEQRIVQYAEIAANELETQLGATLYAAVDTDSLYAEDRVKLARAEAFLTLSHLLPVLNLRINPNEGGIVQSVGFAETKNSLMSVEDVHRLAQEFRDKANDIISAYIEVEDEDEINGGDGIGWFVI